MNRFSLKKIKLNTNEEPEIQIAERLLKDFNEFKEKNNLAYCSFHQHNGDNYIDITWSTTIKKNKKYERYEDLSEEFIAFVNLNDRDYCSVTKITCQDTSFVTEFSIMRRYEIE